MISAEGDGDSNKKSSLEKLGNAPDSDWFQIDEELPWWSGLGKRILQVHRIPKHIAFVMDGNRRYARQHHLESVIQGHSQGFEKMTKVLEWCRELGVVEVTLYAFSIENFKRDEAEVNGLMRMAEVKFEKLLAEKEKLKAKEICFRFFGDMSLLSEKIQILIAKIEHFTRNFKKGFVNVCIAYTSQNEISRAMKWIQRGYQKGLIEEIDINENLINMCLDSRNSLEVDMLIRTSGEHRLSDFLLWQCSNCYLHFEDVLWPELNFWHLFKAILQYQYSRNFIKNISHAIENPQKNKPRKKRVKEFCEWMESEIWSQKLEFLTL